jgi:hypothetical protein
MLHDGDKNMRSKDSNILLTSTRSLKMVVVTILENYGIQGPE